MKKVIIFSFIFILICQFGGVVNSKSADINFEISSKYDSVYKGNEISFVVSAEAFSEINLATFKLTINFDNERLNFKHLYAGNIMNDSELKYNVNDSKLDIIFLTESEGISISKGNKIDLFEVDFKVEKRVTASSTTLSLESDGVGNYEESYLVVQDSDNISVDILEEPKFDCRLVSLQPLEAKLSPDFEPDIFNYDVEVPSDFKEIEFEADPIESDAIVKVSRRTLKKAGEETNIKVTVLSPDKKSRLVYRVNVKRDAKEETVSKNNSEKQTKSKSDKSKNSERSRSGVNSDNSGSSVKSSNKSQRLESNRGGNDPIKSKSKVNKTEIFDSDDDEDLSENKTLIMRENGFNFIIFIIVTLTVVGVLIFIWYRRKSGHLILDDMDE